MKKVLSIFFIIPFVYSAELLEPIIVEDQFPLPQVKTIEQEIQINEQTLDQKLFNTVSINQTQSSSNSKVISIRGNNYRATNYYEDGIELYRTANGYTDLSMYQTNNSKIEINSGASQSIYGPSATGGDVYINSNKIKSGLHGSLTTTLSNNNVYASTSISHKSDDYYFLLDLNGIKQNSFDLSHNFKTTSAQPDLKRKNSDKEQFNGSLKVGYNIDSNTEIAFKVSHMQGKFGNPAQVDVNASDCGFECTRIDDKELTSYWLYYNYQEEDIKVQLRAYYDEYKDTYNFYTTTAFNTLKASSSTYLDTRAGAIASLQYNYNEKNNGTLAFKFDRLRHTQVEVGDPTDEEYGTNEYALSYLHNYKASDKLLLSLSTSLKQQNITEAHDFNTVTIEDYKDRTAIDAQFTANYAFNKEQSYYISIARKNRFASLRELFPFFSWDAEKNNVKPEMSNSIEVGTTLKTVEDTIINISMYYNDIEDLMLYDSAQFSTAVSDSATMQGVEIILNNFSLKDNEFSLSYAYTDAKGSDKNQISQVPKSKLFLQDIFSINNKTNFIASYLYTSKRYDLYNSTRYTLSSYSLIDAQISYESSKNLLLKAGVKNLLDKNWEYTYGQPAYGRSYFVNLNFSY
ncbi:TonB-dependent receptor [Sulfurimonas sp.]|nr:TonB-dependent receptor [Sulfurimonas sp.]